MNLLEQAQKLYDNYTDNVKPKELKVKVDKMIKDWEQFILSYSKEGNKGFVSNMDFKTDGDIYRAVLSYFYQEGLFIYVNNEKYPIQNLENFTGQAEIRVRWIEE